MITEWTYDLTVLKPEVDDTDDTENAGHVTLAPDTRAAEDLGRETPSEDIELELVGWFE